ncbi:MAG: hypothetical protein ACOYD1_03480 [Candidatus Nanopelagicales bacterium]
MRIRQGSHEPQSQDQQVEDWDRNPFWGPKRNANIAYVLSGAAVLLGGALYLLRLNARLWFFQDDFSYLATMPVRSTKFVTWLFAPANEHTVVWTKLWFQLVARTIGLNSYWPFAVALVGSQLLLAVAAAMLTIRITGSRWIALAAAASLMLMGSPLPGVDNLVWASQTVFVLPPALLVLWLCISAWEKLPRRVPPAVAVTAVFCVVGSLASAVFLVASLGIAIDAASRRRWAVAATAPLVSGLTWLMLTRVLYQPEGLPTPELTPGYLLHAAGLAAGYLFRIMAGISGGAVGAVLVLGATVVGIALIRRRPVALRVVVALVVVAYLEMVVVAFTRSQAFGDSTLRSRYGGLALSLLIPAWAVLLGALAQAARRRSESGWFIIPVLAAGTGLALLVVLAVGGAIRLDKAGSGSRLAIGEVNRQQAVQLINWAATNPMVFPPEGVATVAGLSTLSNEEVQYYYSRGLGPSGRANLGGQRLADISLRITVAETTAEGWPPCQVSSEVGSATTVVGDRLVVLDGPRQLVFAPLAPRADQSRIKASQPHVSILTASTNLRLSVLSAGPLAYRVSNLAGPLRLCR